MTKQDVLDEVGRRLGNTEADFLTLLATIFDRCMDELASHDAIKQLHKKNTFTFTANVRDYSSRTLCGLSTPHYPRDVKYIVVPAWGAVEGFIGRVSEQTYLYHRLLSTDEDGANVQDRPTKWTFSPNETVIAFDPAPRTDDATDTAEVYFIAPPTVLGLTDNITELRQEAIPALIGGMIKHGLVFQQETLIDRPSAIRDWELFLINARAEATRERGRTRRSVYRDV